MQGTKVSDDIMVAGQVTEEEIRQASQEGFRSILNLRAPEEDGVLAQEREKVEAAGLSYINIPVRKTEISDDLTTRVLSEIDKLPKPALIHCGTGMRAGAMAFMHMATRQGLTADKAMGQAHSLGFDCNSEPQLKQFFEHYVNAHSAKSA